MRRILITGVGGFVGRHLAERLRADADAEIVGLGTAATCDAPCDRYLSCDLTDPHATSDAVDDAQAEEIYHLAGLTAGAEASRLQAVNVDGFANLCDALRRYGERSGKAVRLLAVGSAAELGETGVARLPVREDAPCEPTTAYGRSKWEATRRALRESPRGLLQTSVARTFNLVGPGLGANLALGRFARQIAAVRRGEAAAVSCGNLEPRRDYVDVRDACAAFVAVLRRGRAGELYNICSGRSYRIGDLLESMIAASGGPLSIVAERTARPGDVADVYGDPTKTAREVGWTASTPIEHSLRDLMASVAEAVSTG